jgi:hypothetical protein
MEDMAVKPEVFSQKNVEREFIIRVPPNIQQPPRSKPRKTHAYLFIVPFLAASGMIALLQTQGISLNTMLTRPDYIIEIIAGVILIDIIAYIAVTTLLE